MSKTVANSRKRPSTDTVPSLPSSKLKENKKVPKVDNPEITNKYGSNYQGPFDVFVQSNSKESTSLYPITVGRCLSASTKQDIIEIKKLGYSKVLIQMKTREAANKLINNPILKAKALTVYIPTFRTTRQGIIRNVPLDITEEEVKTEIISPFDIAKVRRLNRKNHGSSSSDSSTVSYIPSRTVAVSFKGQSLPKYIFLRKVRYEINPFVSSISMCSSCLRYGHNKDQYKGQPRCPHCSDKMHEGDTPCPKFNLPPTCANCKGPHSSNYQSCPERLIQRQIRELAACRNIPFVEAKTLFEALNRIITLVPILKQILLIFLSLKDLQT